MDEHKCQNQSLISTISFRLQVCWYCCYGLSRGLKLGSHLSLIQWPRQEALWIHEQLPMSVHSSSIYHVTWPLQSQERLTGALGAIGSTIYSTSFCSLITDILYWLHAAQSLLRSKEYHGILWNPYVHYCVQKNPTCYKPEPGEFSLRPLILVCKIHLNIILSFMPRYSICTLSFGFSTKILDTSHPT